MYNEDFFYPINFLRDITIESVRTTHFLLIDVDVFLSGRWFIFIYEIVDQTENDIDLHKEYLSEMNVFLMISLWRYYGSPKKCTLHGECNEV